MKTTAPAFKAFPFQWVSQSGYQTGAEGSGEVGQAGTRTYTQMKDPAETALLILVSRGKGHQG